LRRWLAGTVLVGSVLIFVVEVHGWLEVIIRAITGTSALAIYVFWMLDIYRDARQHRRSARIEKIEKFVAAVLWFFIAVLVIALLFLPRKP
jgi:hypothetical protein